jgi:Domain of unknown function (DUF6969)
MLTATEWNQDDLTRRLRQLQREELLAMYDAAAEATECAAALAERGANPVTEALAGATVVEEWMHFPPGDMIDPATHSQFYYHAHAAEERAAGEHGHFHTFLSPRKIDPALTPAAVADLPDASDDAAWTMHLVGISTDASGRIIRLFTTNRWVTGEVWFDADSVISLLDRFAMTTDKPSQHLNRWVSAVTRMFKPQIEDLIRARDAEVEHFWRAHPGSNVFEDRALQVTSEMPVDVPAQIRAIEAVLA